MCPSNNKLLEQQIERFFVNMSSDKDIYKIKHRCPKLT